MTWYNLTITHNGKRYATKYFRLTSEKKEYPYCDADGNILERVSGKVERGHFINPQTKQTHEKAFRLINGKPTEGFKGRIKEVERTKEIPRNEVDIVIEKQFLIDNEELYNYLKESGKAIVFGGWWGNGYSAEKCYIYASDLFPNFCEMVTGISSKLETGRTAILQATEIKRLKEKLQGIDITLQKVNKANAEELIAL